MKSSEQRALTIGVEAISAGAGFGSAAGGMVVYFDGLLRALARLEEIQTLIAFVPPWRVDLGIPEMPRINQVLCRGLPRNKVGRVLYEQSALPFCALFQRPDVLLSTCNIRPFLWRGPSAVVVQSIQHRFFPELYPRLRRMYLDVSVVASVRRADAVIAVSKWQREQIIELFDLEPERVFTVYHGLSNIFRETARAAQRGRTAKGKRPYVVMVSTLYRFKNHTRLIEAFADVTRALQIPHELLIAGGEADVTFSELQDTARRCGVADRVRLLGPVHHADVPELVAGADVVAYPSLMETFGHPILEALALGRCVLTSNRGAMAEVAGGAARLVDPTDVEHMATGLADAILDASLRDRLALMGPRRAAEFTWERCAEETLRVLRYAIARRRGS